MQQSERPRVHITLRHDPPSPVQRAALERLWQLLLQAEATGHENNDAPEGAISGASRTAIMTSNRANHHEAER